MSKQLKGIVVWLIVLVLMVAGLSYLGEKLQTQNNYSYKELEQDLENHQVSEAVIHQNQQTPTGQLIVVLTNGRNKDMYIDDVKEVRQMLENANVVGTPGSGFGPSGETYFRLTAFGSYENTVEAVNRIKAL